jgi:hypothetical protein
MSDRLALIHDDHLRTMVTELDAAVTMLMPAVSLGKGCLVRGAELRELVNSIATAADYLAELRDQNCR